MIIGDKVQKALHCIDWSTDDTYGESEGEQYLYEFQQRWGSLDHEVLWQLARSSEEADSAFAVTALYYEPPRRDPEHVQQFLPLLSSPNPFVRWAAALALGDDLQIEALPVLYSVLTEYLTEDAVYAQTVDDQFWYHFSHWRCSVPDKLARYHDTNAIPYLRQALIAAYQGAVTLEQQSIHPLTPQSRQHNIMLGLQRNVVFNLGRFEAWGAICGITLDTQQLQLWQVHLCVGAVHHTLKPKLFLRYWREYPELSAAVQAQLLHRFGLTPEEQMRALQVYEADSRYMTTFGTLE